MGVKGLKDFLRKNSPEVFETIHISEYSFKKVAIDIAGYVNRYKRKAGDKWLSQVLNLVACLRKYNVHAIFVYDGTPPIEKKAEQDKRRKNQENIETRTAELKQALEEYDKTGEVSEILIDFGKRMRTTKSPVRLMRPNPKGVDIDAVRKRIDKRDTYTDGPTSEDFSLTKKMMKILKVPYINAPAEAETVCADLCKRGLVDASLSDDSDTLAYCTPIWLSDFSAGTGECVRVHTNDVLKSLDINGESLTDFCIMCGTDYNDNIPKIGPKSAFKLITAHKTIEAIADNTGLNVDILKHKASRRLFTQYEQVDAKVPYCTIPDYKELGKFIFTHNIHISIEHIKSSFERKIFFE